MKISKKLIVQEAKEIKNFVEKNKVLPRYATINGSQFSQAQYCYILAKQISKMSLPTITKITVKKPNNSNGNDVDLIIYKNDYIDIARRVALYIELHKQAPNYVTYASFKIKFELFTFCFAKILSFYNENNHLPNYCKFKSTDIKNTATTTINNKKNNSTSTSTTKKTSNSTKKESVATTIFTSKPHYTTTGCNKLGQCTGYFCGPHSIHQAIKKFGITRYTEKQIAAMCGTTTKGTDHKSINTAIAKISKETKIKLSVKWKNFSDMGNTDNERFKAIGKLLNNPNVAVFWHIAYINGGNSINGTHFGHYEYVDTINSNTKYVRALNSLGTKKNDGSYTGKLQDRQYSIQSYFARNTPGQQPALCIISKE